MTCDYPGFSLIDKPDEHFPLTLTPSRTLPRRQAGREPLPDASHCDFQVNAEAGLLYTSYFRLPTPYSLLVTPYSRLPIPDSLLPTCDSLLPTSDSLRPTPYARLPTLYSLHPTPYSLLPISYFYTGTMSRSAACERMTCSASTVSTSSCAVTRCTHACACLHVLPPTTPTPNRNPNFDPNPNLSSFAARH